MRRIGYAASPCLVLIPVGTSVMLAGEKDGDISDPVREGGCHTKQHMAQGGYSAGPISSDTSNLVAPLIHSVHALPVRRGERDEGILLRRRAAPQNDIVISLNSARPMPALHCRK